MNATITPVSPGRVTVITTCLNRVKTIGRSIESVLSQDYPDIEYIVVDGASTDGSVEVIRSYGRRITKVISEPDGGMYEAVNKGIRLATGDVVGLLHSDDVFYDRTVISRIMDALWHSDADMVYGDGLFARDGRVVRNWVSGPCSRWKLRMGWLPLHPTCYVRRSCMERLGLYDERYSIAADTEWLFRYLFIHRVTTIYLAEYIVRMDMGGLSTGKATRRRAWSEDVALYSAHSMPALFMKLMKMMWKVPQFVDAWGEGRSVTRSQLMVLLRDSLWRSGVPMMSYSAQDFSSIIHMARQQSVSALVADSLVRNKIHINDDTAMEVMAILIDHQRKMKRLDRAVTVLATTLAAAAIPYVVFKGQMVARYYVTPSLRSTGDVDFFVPADSYERAVRVITETLGVTVVDDHLDKHSAFVCQGVRYEMHYRIETFGFCLHQRRFDNIIAAEMKQGSPTLRLGDVEVKRLKVETDIMVVFKHLFNHLLVEGVGLRQLCDLAMMLNSARGHYDADRLAMMLRQIGYYRAFKAIGALLVNHLGMDVHIFPYTLTDRDYTWSNRIMAEVMAGGNFGRYGRRYNHSGWAKSMETAWIAMRHCLKFLPLAPLDILCIIPRRISISFKKHF